MNFRHTLILAMAGTLMLTACGNKEEEKRRQAIIEAEAEQLRQQAKDDSLKKVETERAEAAAEQARLRPVFYVVVASFENLQEAMDYNANGPGDCDCGNVFEASANGNRVYRVCESCYYSKAKAQQRVNECREFWQQMRDVTPWIWENAGEARYMGAGSSNEDGSPVYIRPE